MVQSNDFPCITIITPSFNQSRFLEETLLSVLEQGYPNLEYLVFDGGSTDGSVEIIRKYANGISYWESQPDRGQSHALNKGFARSNSEIIGYLNSDDAYLPGALWTVAHFFAENPAVDMVYGDQVDMDETGQVFRATRSMSFNRLALLSRSGAISQPACFWRRRVYDNLGGLDETFNWAMDYEFFLRAAYAGFRIVHLSKPLAKFRYHSTSKTVTGKKGVDGRERELRQVQERYRGSYSWRALGYWNTYFRFKHFLVNIDSYNRYLRYYWRRWRGILIGRSDARF